jgi:hypothetical protein
MTETWSSGATAFLDPPDERLARSPPFPPRLVCGKRVSIQVLYTKYRVPTKAARRKRYRKMLQTD